MKRIALLLLLVAISAHAEVMDKEPSLLIVWVGSVFAAAILFTVARFRPWLLFVAIPPFALLFYGVLPEVTDPAVAAAINREAGFSYIASSWAAPVVALGSVVFGLYARRHALLPNKSLNTDAPKDGAPVS